MADILPTNEGLEESPKVKEISNAPYLSFEFSQGSPVIQRQIYHYLHLARPDWKVEDSERELITRNVYERIKKRFFGNRKNSKNEENPTSDDPTHTGVIFSDVRDQTLNELEKMIDNLNEPHLSSENGIESLVGILTGFIIVRDLRFLKGKPKGRDRRKKYGADSSFDPWKSHMQHYVVQGNPAPTKEYTQMFQDMRNWLKKGIIEGEIKIEYEEQSIVPEKYEEERVERFLSDLAKRWEKKHKGRDFFEGLDLPEGIIKR